jgi:hypothetical protein
VVISLLLKMILRCLSGRKAGISSGIDDLSKKINPMNDDCFGTI